MAHRRTRFAKKYFLTPRVYIFIVIGTGVIFLTFLTENNALEIAISGFASIFIGIGVNNFTTLEIHQKDQQKIKSKLRYPLKVMELVNAKTERIQKEMAAGNYEITIPEFTELRQLISLGIALLKEEAPID